MTAGPLSPPTAAGDLPAKLDRLQGVLATVPSGSVLALTSPPVLSWLLDGARVTVAANGAPVLAALVGSDGLRVRCFANELDRMRAEELPPGCEVEPVPWHEDLLAGAGTVVGEEQVGAALRTARASLLPLELARYRDLCAATATVLTQILAEVRPEDTEMSVAARVAADVVALGADPLVVLVSGESRGGYRHPLPTTAALGRRAMVVVCARRHGMIANVTRWVEFGPPDPRTVAATDRLLQVEADVLDACRPGTALADLFDVVVASYDRHGFGAEWRHHHQGGPAGYLGRDPRVVPGVEGAAVAGQVFAWNPTAVGVKVEDTVLLGDDGIEVLTVDPAWPVVQVRGRSRPAALPR